MCVSMYYALKPWLALSLLFPYTTLFRSGAVGAANLDSEGYIRDWVMLAPVPLSDRETCAEALLRSEEHTSELQSLTNLVCRLLLEKKNIIIIHIFIKIIHLNSNQCYKVH